MHFFLFHMESTSVWSLIPFMIRFTFTAALLSIPLGYITGKSTHICSDCFILSAMATLKIIYI